MSSLRKLVVALVAVAALLALPAAALASQVIWAVGDGAAGSSPGEDGTTDDQVGALVNENPFDAFLYLGDVYSTGTVGSAGFKEFAYYDAAYGSYKAKSYPTPGNHDWPNRSLSTGYDAYWPQFSSPHYYSFDIGGWHVISLNSEEAIGAGSEQVNWLQADLAANQGTCALAFWHRPRYTASSVTDTGNTLTDDSRTSAVWQALSGHASLVLNGHVHNYQRLNPINGITELIVGSGGEHAEHHAITNPADPRLANSNDTDFGALKMVLEPGRADFQLINLNHDVLDSGSVDCQTKPGASTGSAAPDDPTSATLGGSVDPNGLETTYRFEYGRTAGYDAQTADAGAGAGADPQDVSAQISGLTPDTTYHYRLVATNSAGTTYGQDGTFTTPVTLSVDIEGGPSGLTNEPMPRFDFSSNETVATFQCSIQQGDAVLGDCSGPGTSHQPAAPLGEGTYTFQVTATDPLGQTATATRSFTVDATAPDTTIGSAPPALTRDPTPTFSFSSVDASATFQCRIDGRAFASCTSPRTTGALSDGPHTFAVRAIDAAGNSDPTPASRTFTVDATSPQTTLTKRPPRTVRTRTAAKRVRFKFTGSDNLPTMGPVHFECRLDSAPLRPCGSPLARKVGLGSHSFAVRAIDAAGNADPTPATARWRVIRRR